VTILLVVIGAISLVIGFVQSSLLPIYISIGCSVLAAVVLLIFSRMTTKSQQVVTAGGGPMPLDERPARSDRTEPVPAFAGTGLIGESSSETFAPDGGFGGSMGDEPDDIDDDDFPIERYDTRRVGEILPLLAELDLDELDLVREREEEGKGRATVLARIDQLIDQLEAEDRQEAASRREEDEVDVDDEADELAAPPAVARKSRTTQAVSVAALPEDDDYFPIEDYDDLRASEILPLLPELDDDELVMVRTREQAGPARPSVLRRIDALVAPADAAPAEHEDVEDEAAPLLVPVPSPLTTAKVPSRSAMKKSAAKRSPASKKAPTVKTAPATKAAPRRAARSAPEVAPVVVTKKAPAKRAAVSKATTKVSAVPRRGAPTAAVPVKKAAATRAVKKVPAQKAGPAKATVVKRTGALPATKPAKVTRKTTKS